MGDCPSTPLYQIKYAVHRDVRLLLMLFSMPVSTSDLHGGQYAYQVQLQLYSETELSHLRILS